MLALRSQNQDLSERAVDDARRLALLETANERLETSVQAYQDERMRLEAAYKELRASLPGALQPLSSSRQGGPGPPRPMRGNELDPVTEPWPPPEHDPDIKQADGLTADPGPRTRARSGKAVSKKAVSKKAVRKKDGWLPSRSDGGANHDGESTSTGAGP